MDVTGLNPEWREFRVQFYKFMLQQQEKTSTGDYFELILSWLALQSLFACHTELIQGYDICCSQSGFINPDLINFSNHGYRPGIGC